MDKLIALSIGGQKIVAPTGVPTGGLSKFMGIAQNVIEIALIFIVVISVIFILIAGIKYVTAGGDKTKVASARSTITYAILGLILAFVAFLIVNIIARLVFGGTLFLPSLTINPFK